MYNIHIHRCNWCALDYRSKTTDKNELHICLYKAFNYGA